MDTIFSKIIPPDQIRAIRLAMGDGFAGLDRSGSPIYWSPVGSIYLNSLKGVVPLSNIVLYHIQLMEFNKRSWLRNISIEQKRCRYQTTCVMDLKGFGTKNTSGIFWECMHAITAIDKDFYY